MFVLDGKKFSLINSYLERKVAVGNGNSLKVLLHNLYKDVFFIFKTFLSLEN